MRPRPMIPNSRVGALNQQDGEVNLNLLDGENNQSLVDGDKCQHRVPTVLLQNPRDGVKFPSLVATIGTRITATTDRITKIQTRGHHLSLNLMDGMDQTLNGNLEWL